MQHARRNHVVNRGRRRTFFALLVIGGEGSEGDAFAEIWHGAELGRVSHVRARTAREANMATTSVHKVSEWKAVLAATLYLATFLALGYGLYAVARGASFLESFALAYPHAFAACLLFFACSTAFEILKTTLKKSPAEAKRVTVHSYIPR
jgi:hypothetical protein